MADMKDSGASTPKRLGAGDGDKIVQGSARKRVPTPSSRKFNARVKPDPNLRLKLEEALKEIEGKCPKAHSCMKKACTIAEITPTKKKAKFGRAGGASEPADAESTLHATPRRRPPPASRRPDGAVGAAYRRLLLLAWRRCRQRLAEEQAGNSRRAEQVTQLEMQVDVLKNLQETENKNRADAVIEYQRFRRKYEVLELENNQLIDEVECLKKSLEHAQNNFKVVSEKLRATENELNNKRDEWKNLLNNLSNCEGQLHSKDSLITELGHNLKNVSRDLKAVEDALKTKETECEDTAKHLEEHARWNESLKMQVDLLTEVNQELENKTNELELSLQLQLDSNQMLTFENSVLKETVFEKTIELEDEKKKTWFKNTKEFALLSVSALQKIADIMLPAYNV